MSNILQRRPKVVNTAAVSEHTVNVFKLKLKLKWRRPEVSQPEVVE